ncbi:polysaccharide biosynthesis protein [Thiopseudomonas acetoxidans]|uniref:Nucleoside-diphosphate sugar epimerase/dehydratase n=1 Tax=Thiopseudomonas acetoxidans TaxID=3041622 RepID=A0ABT7SSD5_9GAMM|nr:nucleoside-diphosphate sugar epimerase/dehydratase [Thiopseudomonas sp. CY1220]MDM7858482.1 nucleoside-diphosphate sugar epimerase/dehydratase [Thiopseudomonas sp. CY1220]
MRDFLLNLPRRYKRILQVVVDVLLIWLCLWLAFVMRLGFDKAWVAVNEHEWLFVVAPLVTIPVSIRFGMYRAVMRYLGREALVEIAKAVTMAALALALLVYWMQSPGKPQIPRSFVMLYWINSLLAIGGLRLLMRQYFTGDWMSAGQQLVPFLQTKRQLPRVAIYGAGSAGNQLVRALRMGKAMEPVAFIDDDDNIATRTIAGLKVYKPKHIEEMLRVTGATQVLLAVPSASRARRREILAQLESYPVHVRTVPGFMDLASGRVKVNDLQEVDIADLLGRDVVTPNQALFERCIKERVVMVTGAGGSIGAELCRQILASGATTLILYEHSEFNLYSIQQELERRIKHEALRVQLVPVLGSIRNKKHLLEVMLAWQVDTVYHAAAYKHVPIVEQNIVAGIRNNVMGTLYTAQAAIRANVQNFVLISTDKAVRPTNVMGATKRLAEMVLQALSQEQQVQMCDADDCQSYANNTRFTMVRFGNVLGSSGSVIPLFREQIKRGGPVTVTHPKMTRYFMTIPEASQLVIQAGSLGQGGDVFVLDMGEPVTILDMAEKMIRLTGLTVRSETEPNGEIAIEFTGLRPGEKLYEELLIGDNVSPTEHEMIMRANEELLPWAELSDVLQHLIALAEQGDCTAIRQLLRDTVNGYTPQCEIVDLVYNQNK